MSRRPASTPYDNGPSSWAGRSIASTSSTTTWDRAGRAQRGARAIAAELNHRGLRTGAKLAWTVGAVRAVRYDHDLYRPSPKSRRAPGQRADGLCSVHAVAVQVGVRPSLVRQWARTGVLQPAVVGGPGRPHWFHIDPVTLERLLEAKRRHWRERNDEGVVNSLSKEGNCE